MVVKVVERHELFLESKILSLKGTHNWFADGCAGASVVSRVKDTKFERNSQPLYPC